jgi:agmatine deiminase
MQNNRYSMPAEWARHERTLISWPVRASLVYPDNYGAVAQGYAAVVKASAAFEAVTLGVGGDTRDEARALCGTDNVEYLTLPHNDAWLRDNGPTFVLDNEDSLYGVNWRFNAWGGKYGGSELDDTVAKGILRHFNVPVIDSPLVMEGGSIHVDGEGTLLTTRECLLNKNRNPHLSQAELEDELGRLLGVRSFIWLERGLDGDETDGHVDNIACFARPGVILMQTCHDESDANFQITRENLSILSRAVDAQGRRTAVVEIPQPPMRQFRGKRLTLSYLNFYLVNGGLILPVFGGDAEQTDKQAAGILQSVFPDRRIVPADGTGLITDGGNVHCITQQLPLGIR